MSAIIVPFPEKKKKQAVIAPLPDIKVHTCGCGSQKFYLEGAGTVVCAECMHTIRNLTTTLKV